MSISQAGQRSGLDPLATRQSLTEVDAGLLLVSLHFFSMTSSSPGPLAGLSGSCSHPSPYNVFTLGLAPRREEPRRWEPTGWETADTDSVHQLASWPTRRVKLNPSVQLPHGVNTCKVDIMPYKQSGGTVNRLG